MSSVYSACFSFNSPNNLSRKTSEKPMIALSGVRSSCDTLARNSDLCRLAASSCRPLSSISRNSRAFWIAKSRLRRKGLSRFTTSGSNLPTCRRHTVNPPMICCSRRIGTVRSDR